MRQPERIISDREQEENWKRTLGSLRGTGLRGRRRISRYVTVCKTNEYNEFCSIHWFIRCIHWLRSHSLLDISLWLWILRHTWRSLKTEKSFPFLNLALFTLTCQQKTSTFFYQTHKSNKYCSCSGWNSNGALFYENNSREIIKQRKEQ